MAQFRYRARTLEGKEVKGMLTAASADRAHFVLQQNSLQPLTIDEGAGSSLLQAEVLGRRVTTKDLTLFSRQLAAMVRAGVPILEAIKALEKQTERPALASLLRDVAYDIEGGDSLSNTLAKHPGVFSLFYLGVVKTGEASGRLSESLEILADYLEQNYIFTRKIRSAMMYPLFVLTGVVIVVALMFVFVVPQLVELFEEANVLLPLPTRILIGVSNFMQSYWYIVLLALLVFGVLLRSYAKTPEGQYTIGSWTLRIPLLSRLVRKVYLARLTSILHTLFSSDVPVLESLTIARSSVGNVVYQRILDDTIGAVKDGVQMSVVWQHEQFIPGMLTTMVGVGERSGNVEQAFKEAHDFFRRDVNEILDSITVFLEPVLVIVLGLGVAIVVAAVLLPIYNLVLVL